MNALMQGRIGRGMAPLATGVVFATIFSQLVQNFTFTAGTETFTINLAIPTDADFIVTHTMFDNSLIIQSTGQAAGAGMVVMPQGGATILLTDTASGRQLQNAAVPLNTLFGSAQRPYVWPFAHKFRAGAGIGINIVGAGGAMAGGIVRLVFSGLKVQKE